MVRAQESGDEEGTGESLKPRRTRQSRGTASGAPVYGLSQQQWMTKVRRELHTVRLVETPSTQQEKINSNTTGAYENRGKLRPRNAHRISRSHNDQYLVPKDD